MRGYSSDAMSWIQAFNAKGGVKSEESQELLHYNALCEHPGGGDGNDFGETTTTFADPLFVSQVQREGLKGEQVKGNAGPPHMGLGVGAGIERPQPWGHNCL